MNAAPQHTTADKVSALTVLPPQPMPAPAATPTPPAPEMRRILQAPLTLITDPFDAGSRRSVWVAPRDGEGLIDYLRRVRVPDFPGPVVVFINGLDETARVREVVLERGDFIEVVAALHDDFGGILALAAIFAVAFFQPQLAGAFAELGFSEAVASGLAAGSLAVGGAIIASVLAPKPDLPKALGGNAAPTFSVTAARNRVRKWEPMLLVLGRHRIQPDIAAQPYGDFRGSDQYLKQVFHFGIGDLLISEPKFGAIDVDRYSDVTISTNRRDGSLPGAEDVVVIPGAEVRNADGRLERRTAERTYRVAADLVGQLSFTDSKGDRTGVFPYTVNMLLERKLADAAAWTEIERRAVEGGGITPLRETIDITLPAEGVYDIGVTKLDRDRSEQGHASVTNDVTLESLKCFQRDTTDYGGQNRQLIEMRASGQLSGQLDNYSAVVEQLIPFYKASTDAWVPPALEDEELISVTYGRGEFWAINATTGARRLVWDMPDGSPQLRGLARIGADLFGLGAVGADMHLYKIDLTARTITDIGDTGLGPSARGFGAYRGIAYAHHNAERTLYTINIDTAVATAVGPTGLNIGMPALDGVENGPKAGLYSISLNTMCLYSLNHNTGAATLVGALNHGLQSEQFFHGLGGFDDQLRAISTEGRFWAVNLYTGAATQVVPLESGQFRDIWKGFHGLCAPASPVFLEAMRNPAAQLRAFAKGWFEGGELLAGCGLLDSQLDDAALKRWARYCDAEDLKCDLVIDSRQSRRAVMETIARCGRADIDASTGRLSVVFLERGQPAGALISPANMIAGSYQSSWASGADLADEVVARFVDPANDNEHSVVRATLSGVENPARSTDIELKGITRQSQASEEANLALARGQLLRRRHAWRMAAEGQILKRFDVLQLAAPRLTDAGRLAGRDATGLSITLPEQVDLGETATGNVWLYYPNGVTKHFACDCGLEAPVLYAAPIAAAATQPGSTAAYGRNRLRQIINHTDGIEVRIVNESGNLRRHQLSSSRGESQTWLQLGSRLLNFYDASRTFLGNIQGIGPTASYRWRGVESGGWEAGQTARIGARYPIAYVLRLTLPALSATDGDTAAVGMEAAWKHEDIHYQFQETAAAELVAVTGLTPAADGTVQVEAEDYLADYFSAKDNPAVLERAPRTFTAPVVSVARITQQWRYLNGLYERVIDLLIGVTGDFSGALVEGGAPFETVATIERGLRARWVVSADSPSGNYAVRITPGSREFPLGTPATTSVRLTENDLRPDAPTQLSAHESLQRETVLVWAPPRDKDIVGYQVRLASGAAADWDAMIRAHTGIVAEAFLRLDNLGPGAYTFAVKTINEAGNESADAVFVSHTVSASPGDEALWYSEEVLLAWPGTLNGFVRGRAGIITKSSLTWDTLPPTWDAWTSWSQSPVATATYQREIDLGASRTFRIVTHAERTDGTGHAIEASWSADNATWSAFAAVSNAAVTARYVRVRLTAHTDGVTPACIKRFTILLTETS